ncbi:hypothetical protein [Hyalangium rubrum]|uniref:Uncharacterized protein n=1 Tax=Hyalangium rubrum TaxID=3103134 RepID=A0ABU5HCT5_9BACT|nr:hypothetical protein [Hyalangium sp. s54d21]MDY7231272.1 hypothetical protein [Hyalangium sp. s54d21]
MQYFDTKIWLPPEIPSTERVCRFLRLVFEEYRWFRPTRYGFAFMDGKLDPEHVDYDALGAFYEERKVLRVAARTDRDYISIFPAKGDASRPEPEFPYTGKILWTTSAKEAAKPRWRAAHLRQVQELMSLVGSPLAQAGIDEDFDRKTNRLVPNADGFGQQQVFTVRDYSEGLAGLYWRNFLGAPFVRLFSERLDALPAECRQELGDELVLVQPYELPSQAGTPEGDARERQLISVLGPECFYDHERHVKPTRRPPLGPPVH